MNMTELFIQKAKLIHGDKYDYSKVEYINTYMKIKIYCKIHNFDFLMTPSNHLSGQKCKICSMENRSKLRNYGNDKFIEKAKLIHDNKYDYSKINYINSQTNIIIICNEHGEFEQKPVKHLQGHNCILCSNISRAKNKTDNNKSFIEKAKLIHDNKYDYSKINYIDSQTNIIIICNEHGEFEQKPANHLQGNNCILCSNILRSVNQRLSLDEFIERAKSIYGNTYDYSKVNYTNIDIKCILKCIKHNFEFEQTPYNHLNYIGCNKCSNHSYSKKAINWLNFISKFNDLNIQHAENIGEYIINNTKFKADGYCEETNTIYEFHGTIYHGDPRWCNPNDFNYLGKNYGELYQKTLEREQQIKNLGYNLIVIWEYDWNKINKSIKKLQRKIRNFKH